MADGPDYGILLSHAPAAGQPLGEVLDGVFRRRAQLQQMQQAQYQQQRQRGFSALVSQNADAYPDPTARAYALGGYGDEAQAAQQASLERQKTAQVVDQYHRSVTASRLAQALETGSQADFDKIAAAAPESYGLTPGAANWTEQAKGFRKGFVTPEQEAQNAALGIRAQALRDRADRGVVRQNALGQMVVVDPLTGEEVVADSTTKPVRPVVGKGRGGAAAAGPAVPNDKELAALMKDIDPSLGRSGLFGKDQGIRTAAQKVLALVKNPETGAENYNLTVKQMPEFVQSVAGMLSSGSVPAQAQLEHLMPETAGKSLAEKLEYFTGHPELAQQPEFVKQYADTAKREDMLAAKRIREVQLARLAAHQGAYAHNPAAAKALAKQYLKDLSDGDLDAAFQGKYGGQPAAPAAAGTVPAFTHMRTDPKTGETRGWDGKQWVPVKAGG